MDILLSGVIVLMGGAALMAFFSRQFKTGGMQAYFFVMSILLFLGSLVMVINSPNMGTQETSWVNSTFNVPGHGAQVNVTHKEVYYDMPTTSGGVFAGFLTIMLWGLLFMVAAIMAYFVMDSIMLMRANKAMT